MEFLQETHVSDATESLAAPSFGARAALLAGGEAVLMGGVMGDYRGVTGEWVRPGGEAAADSRPEP